MMHDREKSEYDSAIVAAKPTNKTGANAAAADVARAKALYGQALDLGVARATLRLPALQ